MDGLGNESKSIDGIKPKLADILCTAIRYNTESVVSENGGEIKIIGGNPTERAALAFVSSHEDKHKELKTVRTLPFDSAKKYSAAQVSGDIELTFVKGAPEIILRLCKYCYDGDGNKIRSRAIDVISMSVNDGTSLGISAAKTAVYVETGLNVTGGNTFAYSLSDETKALYVKGTITQTGGLVMSGLSK